MGSDSEAGEVGTSEVACMETWDARFKLRRLALPELKVLAKQHGIPNRSKVDVGSAWETHGMLAQSKRRK